MSILRFSTAWMSRAISLFAAFLSVALLSIPARADAPATQAMTYPATNPDFHVDAKQTLKYLASDELEGRGVGTAGLNKAADLIAGDFAKLGLQPLPGQSGYFQPFNMTATVTPDPKCSLAAGDSHYKLEEDFIPLSASGEQPFEGPVVFVGYGITSSKFNYDDYANLDVKGKIVLAMRV